ncbi:unnamed protein product [Lactuca saligna]|uniref:Beta-lactamase-related domain-containing protein n=1 Tax=Lactuca saligna TaxID=75948 RepID=A0AA36E784_LACSI|nr:unnamed protein product [Lactuca saligna]
MANRSKQISIRISLIIQILRHLLQSNMNNGPSSNAKWLYDSPIHSDVEAKLRHFLVELGNADHRILGIQVSAYKDGKVIIDTSAGVMGKDDPRPVQNDTLFPVFSVTKGVTAGMIHWLADKGKLKFDENVANIWPEFGTNGKDQIKVHHILNHTSGLHDALSVIVEDDPILFCDWDECVKRIATVEPESEPGCKQIYHYLSYGWLCGAIIEHASGKKFQDILEEAFVRPLNVEGEFYIGIPPGVESRLATLTYDKTEFSMFVALTATPEFMSHVPSSFTPNILDVLITSSNTLNVRCAILPASNGHFSARALARYYATLVDGGVVPPSQSSSLPPLGSHPHHPITHSHTTNPNRGSDLNIEVLESDDTNDEIDSKIFSTQKSKLHDLFLGNGVNKDLILPNGKFGLGFHRINNIDGSMIGFGHAGLGGSTGYCDINNRFSIAVTLNKLSFGPLVAEIIQFICSELDLPVPDDYAGSWEFTKKPVFN